MPFFAQVTKGVEAPMWKNKVRQSRMRELLLQTAHTLHPSPLSCCKKEEQELEWIQVLCIKFYTNSETYTVAVVAVEIIFSWVNRLRLKDDLTQNYTNCIYKKKKMLGHHWLESKFKPFQLMNFRNNFLIYSAFSITKLGNFSYQKPNYCPGNTKQHLLS